MLRSTSNIAHKTIKRSQGTVRTKATSASSSASESPSTSKSTSTTPDKGLATLKTTPTPIVESPSTEKKRKVRSPTDPAADYQKLLEERFGGGESAALGQLVDGKPQGMARNVQRNMFRLI
ncbi:hypothetical protein JCM5353_004830 [Sporobolomyces roseus]